MNDCNVLSVVVLRLRHECERMNTEDKEEEEKDEEKEPFTAVVLDFALFFSHF
jgi:hypothetical protein